MAYPTLSLHPQFYRLSRLDPAVCTNLVDFSDDTMRIKVFLLVHLLGPLTTNSSRLQLEPGLSHK